MSDWLPSEVRWLNDLAERIFDGDIFLVRAIPRWGVTRACETIAYDLGESAVVVDGRTVTEENQRDFREDLDRRVRNVIDRTGAAQLLFDNYGHAVRRSQGGHLHSMLYRLLVDSPTARDTGAMLTARPNDMLDPGFSGSPLVGRSQAFVLPELCQEDADALAMSLEDLRLLAGDSTWLARRLLDGGLRQGRVSAVEHLRHDGRRLVEALPPGAVNKLAVANMDEPLDAISREALMCLGHIGPLGAYEPSSFVKESALIDEVQLQNPAWPPSLSRSVERFAEMLAGAESAIWVDRYMFTNPKRTRDFLNRLRRVTSVRLRLLVSDDRKVAGFGRDIASALDGLDDVEVRFMRWADRKSLHDRHLVMRSLGKGYVLPTANVVLAVDEPGTAVAARIPAVDYAPFWDRAVRIFPEA